MKILGAGQDSFDTDAVQFLDSEQAGAKCTVPIMNVTKDTASLSMGAANTTLTANDIRTGWNAGLGVDYCFDPKFCMGTRYRYVSYGSKSLGAITDPTQTVVFAPNRPSAFNEFTLRAWVPLY